MNSVVLLAGVLTGLGVFVAVANTIPGRPRLDAALARIRAHGTAEPALPRSRELVRQIAAGMPWVPVPATDLALLGQDREAWFRRKIICGLTGLGVAPALTALATVAGDHPPWTIPAVASLAVGVAAFFAPDLVTGVKAAARRADFSYALTSYLDLVALERAAGAGPTDALEAAAHVGSGWAFARIEAALEASRKAGRPPWEGLAALAAQTGVSELGDLADIAEVAGQEGAQILQTLAARAESMRAAALAATKARAGARSTTMVVPIALLGGGFLVLLIFPILYRSFG